MTMSQARRLQILAAPNTPDMAGTFIGDERNRAPFSGIYWCPYLYRLAKNATPAYLNSDPPALLTNPLSRTIFQPGSPF